MTYLMTNKTEERSLLIPVRPVIHGSLNLNSESTVIIWNAASHGLRWKYLIFDN